MASSHIQSGQSLGVISYSSSFCLAFDKEFNAITGLNGSGKSNILDAICFVLGIT
jgi:structural maintenance of chromosome 2